MTQVTRGFTSGAFGWPQCPQRNGRPAGLVRKFAKTNRASSRVAGTIRTIQGIPAPTTDESG